MRFTIEQQVLAQMVKLVLPPKRRRLDFRLRLWACQARVFVQYGGVTAGDEALVLEEGECFVIARKFRDVVEACSHHENLTVQIVSGLLLIGHARLRAYGHSSMAVAPAEFKVYPVTDSWVTGGQGTIIPQRPRTGGKDFR